MAAYGTVREHMSKARRKRTKAKDKTADDRAEMTPQDRYRIAAEAFVSDRTVSRWAVDPGSVSQNNRARIEKTIDELRL